MADALNWLKEQSQRLNDYANEKLEAAEAKLALAELCAEGGKTMDEIEREIKEQSE